jgi:hypothetical protein
VKGEAQRLNGTQEDTMQRLHKLTTEAIGGLLVVTIIVDDDGTSIPFITLLATPSVARTFNAVMGNPGVILEDIWDPTVLSDFLPDLTMSGCPGGFFPSKLPGYGTGTVQ